MRFIYKKCLIHSQWEKKKKKLTLSVTQEVSHHAGERTEKLKTTGILVKLEDNFQDSKVRHSVDLLPVKQPLSVKIIKQAFKLSGNCPNSIEQ